MIFRKVISYSLFLASMTLHAEEKTSDFNQQIEMLKTAKTATVILVNPRWNFPDGLTNEVKLKEVGCTFTTQDSALIVKLINLLKRAKIKKISANESFLPVLGAGMYLSFANGTEAKLLFGKEYVNEEVVDAQFTTSIFNEVPIIVNRPLPEDLFQWAAQAGEPKLGNIFMAKDWDKWRKQRIENCKEMTSEKFYRNHNQNNQICNDGFQLHPDICLSGWKSINYKD